jgi:hypothetical protein
MSTLTEIEIVELICRGVDPRTGEILNTPRDPAVDRIRLSLLAALKAMGKKSKNQDASPKTPEAYPNKGKKWTSHEDMKLNEKWKLGMNLDDMADGFGRTPGALGARLVRLSAVKDMELVCALNVKRGGIYGKSHKDEDDSSHLVSLFTTKN